MANFRLSSNSQDAVANLIAALVDSGAGAGIINIYDGVQPPTASTAVTTQNLLAVVPLAKPSFGNSLNGTITANPITPAVTQRIGIATWARITNSNGASIFDCDVGLFGTTLIINNISIQINTSISVAPFTVFAPTG